MKKMTALCAASACFALALAGCEDADMPGTFVANQELQIPYVHGDGKAETFVIPAGTYHNTDVELEDGGKKLEIDFEKGPNMPKKMEVKIRVPKGTIPAEEGDFFIPAEQTGQNYDLSGVSDRYDEYSDLRYTTEQCSEQVREYRCHQVCEKDSQGKTWCRDECGYEYVTVYGDQEVEYRNHYVTRTNDTRFLMKGTRKEVGSFKGSRTDTYREVEYTGPCRLHRRW